MPKHRDRILMIRHYMEQSGESAVDMHKVAEMAIDMGWEPPKPASPVDLLARQFSRSARQEIRKDSETGQPYRVYHAMKVPVGPGEQMVLWVDIDQASRKQMSISTNQRRDQMVGDALQLVRDAEHWNTANPDEEPLQIPLDFEPDVLWKRNAPEEDDD